MPPQPRKQTARGRRDPALLDQQPDTGDAMMDAAIEETMSEDMAQDDHEPGQTQDSLLFFGDIAGMSVTLNVDVTGNGKHDFINYRALTRLQPDEDHEELFGRLAAVVGDGVLSAAADVAQRWEEYQQYLAEQEAELQRVTRR